MPLTASQVMLVTLALLCAFAAFVDASSNNNPRNNPANAFNRQLPKLNIPERPSMWVPSDALVPVEDLSNERKMHCESFQKGTQIAAVGIDFDKTLACDDVCKACNRECLSAVCESKSMAESNLDYWMGDNARREMLRAMLAQIAQSGAKIFVITRNPYFKVVTKLMQLSGFDEWIPTANICTIIEQDPKMLFWIPTANICKINDQDTKMQVLQSLAKRTTDESSAAEPVTLMIDDDPKNLVPLSKNGFAFHVDGKVGLRARHVNEILNQFFKP